MAYTVHNYQTGKALKDDVAAGKQVKVYQPGPFGPDVPDGHAVIEGPHYPKPHTFYVAVMVKDGFIERVLFGR